MAKVATNIEIYNAIRTKLDGTFQTRLPKADANNIKTIGEMLVADDFQTEKNQFFSALLNRIGKTIFHNTNLSNRLAWTYTDPMTYGAFIQQIAVDIVQAEDYDMDDEMLSNPFGISKPDVTAYYYEINSRRKYRVTINNDMIRTAFTSDEGLSTLVAQIINKIHQSAEVDRWFSIKETFQKLFGSDKLQSTQKYQVAGYDTADNLKSTIKLISTIAMDMTFPSRKYNEAKLMNMTNASDLVLFIRQDILQDIDKDVLAYAFNPERMGFTNGETIRIEPMDNFGGLTKITSIANPSDTTALKYYEKADGVSKVSKPYAYNTTKSKTLATGEYTQDIPAEDTKDVIAVLCEKGRIMSVNNLSRFESIFNPAGLYDNYFLHDWNIFVQSGMHNCVIFHAGTWA